MPKRVVVIGGGPGGVMAAIRAREMGASVTLLEKTPRLLNKLRISGKGRCNITNGADGEDFLANILRGERFFRSAFAGFDNHMLVNYLESLGVPTKMERGQRIFPKSDQAADVANALIKELDRLKTLVKTRVDITAIQKEEDCWHLKTTGGNVHRADAIVLATGGKSYPKTGSTGEGYRLAKALGHTIIPPKPSLAPIQTAETWVKNLAGLSLKNVSLSAYQKEKRVFFEQGEMLFTHKGVSGPLALSASCHLEGSGDERLCIDMKPALDLSALDQRIQRDFQRYTNRAISNALGDLLPKSIIPVILSLWEVDVHKPVHQVTKGERNGLIALLKGIPLTVKEIGPIEEAIVTRGGISLKEVNPKTMESKLAPGLYFAGEVLDLDGYTGGFNLQIAFSTGDKAGKSAAITQ